MTPCDDPYPWLSEFLCDYVDGEMPPAEQAAFEEWLRGDPRLAAHVAGLVRTRRICCQSQAPKAPCDFVAALHRRLVAEGLEEAPACGPPRVHGTTRRAAPVVLDRGAAVPLDRLDAASTALLMRSAALLLVLGAVVIARFGLHRETSDYLAAPAVPAFAQSEALAALAPSPERPIELVPLAQVQRRPAGARLVRAHADVRPAAPRAAVLQTNALLRIRAGR